MAKLSTPTITLNIRLQPAPDEVLEVDPAARTLRCMCGNELHLGGREKGSRFGCAGCGLEWTIGDGIASVVCTPATIDCSTEPLDAGSPIAVMTGEDGSMAEKITPAELCRRAEEHVNEWVGKRTDTGRMMLDMVMYIESLLRRDRGGGRP